MGERPLKFLSIVRLVFGERSEQGQGSERERESEEKTIPRERLTGEDGRKDLRRNTKRGGRKEKVGLSARDLQFFLSLLPRPSVSRGLLHTSHTCVRTPEEVGLM